MSRYFKSLILFVFIILTSSCAFFEKDVTREEIRQMTTRYYKQDINRVYDVIRYTFTDHDLTIEKSNKADGFLVATQQATTSTGASTFLTGNSSYTTYIYTVNLFRDNNGTRVKLIIKSTDTKTSSGDGFLGLISSFANAASGIYIPDRGEGQSQSAATLIVDPDTYNSWFNAFEQYLK